MRAGSKAPSPSPGASTTSSGKSPQSRCPSQPRSSIGLTSRFCRGIGASGQEGTPESKLEGSAGDPAQLVTGEPLILGFRHSSQTSGSVLGTRNAQSELFLSLCARRMKIAVARPDFSSTAGPVVFPHGLANRQEITAGPAVLLVSAGWHGFRTRTPCGNALACGTRGPSTEPVPPRILLAPVQFGLLRET